MVFGECALVVELVDTLVLGTSGASRSGSSPDVGTTFSPPGSRLVYERTDPA